ncbi:MAG TPA: protein translocase subunit SecD [Candidatus Pacearchaeota archaeon]|nr:protein translocase subunit SecD [Candidatus Parcubacteria bacterium]HOU45604.1 protein translocase subunit SecD [Candidatus Pacearchaeota archaeon]HPM08562.1 protein translocase subunit SecD [Candidatus Pacearchaeota archaeon]HQI74239.1 protein translocase subunit SecD [Candidatus Pacearchaeota archaeon]
MNKRNTTYIVIAVMIILAVIGGIFIYPNGLNKTMDNIKKTLHLEKDYRLGLDLQGGVELLYQADLSGIQETNKNLNREFNPSKEMEKLKEVIEKRVNNLGVREPEIQVQQFGDKYELSVRLSGEVTPAEAIKEIGRTPFLQFKEPKDNYKEILKKEEEFRSLPEAEMQEIINIYLKQSSEINGKKQYLTYQEQQKLNPWLLAFEDAFKDTELTGRYLKAANVEFSDQNMKEPVVTLNFDVDGAKLFESITARNVGKPVAIYVDNQLISAPNVEEKITGGSARISGQFNMKSATELAKNLNDGALNVPVNIISQKSVGATLGRQSLQASVKAGLIGLALVGLFMITAYRFAGLLSVFSLVFYVIISLCIFKIWPGFTLTLPGIAGFVLSLGMAVDANILIFSRVREELKLGKNFSTALQEGFDRAFPAIRDGNLATFSEVLILYIFAMGFVRGFATTLGIGIIASLFSALVVTKALMEIFVETKLSKNNKIW